MRALFDSTPSERMIVSPRGGTTASLTCWCFVPPRRTSERVPLPRALARFNLKVTNPILGRVAGRLPGFAIVTHVGRRSGSRRTTPVNLFHDGDRYVIALTYGLDSQWVKNVIAAGGCDVLTRGRTIHLVDPQLVHDPARNLVPAPVRAILSAANVEHFLVLRRAT
jgi:deazaflavin-dependent oxidoreductase (nitroreductase family)